MTDANLDIFGDPLPTAEEQAEIDARQASGYWDAIESGRHEVRWFESAQQQSPSHFGDFASLEEAEAEAAKMRERGLDAFTAPIYVYRGNGEITG